MDVNRNGNRRISYLTRTYTSDNWLEQIPEYVREAEPGWERLWELTKDVNIFEMTPAQLQKTFICGLKPVGVFGTGNYQLFKQDGFFQPVPGTTYRIRVLGAGSAGYDYGGSGGGYAERTITIDTADPIQITVGQGGYYSSVEGESLNHLNGGTSSFGNYVSATGGVIYPVAVREGGMGYGGDINYKGGASNGSGGASSGSDLGNGVGTPLWGFGGAGLQTIYPDTNKMMFFGGGGLFTNYQKLYEQIKEYIPDLDEASNRTYIRIAGGGGMHSAGNVERALQTGARVEAFYHSANTYLVYTGVDSLEKSSNYVYVQPSNFTRYMSEAQMQGCNCSDYSFTLHIGEKTYEIAPTEYSIVNNLGVEQTETYTMSAVHIQQKISRYGGVLYAPYSLAYQTNTHNYLQKVSLTPSMCGEFGASNGINLLIAPLNDSTKSYGTIGYATTSGFGAGNGYTFPAYISSPSSSVYAVYSSSTIPFLQGHRGVIGCGGGALGVPSVDYRQWGTEPSSNPQSLVAWGGGAGATNFYTSSRASRATSYLLDASYGGGGGCRISASYNIASASPQTFNQYYIAGGNGMVLVEW